MTIGFAPSGDDTTVGVRLAVPWYRSLYGRVALGYAVLLPMLLAAQAGAVVFLANQRDQNNGSERLERAQVARHLALLVSERLADSPTASLPALVAGLQPRARLFVVMKSGDVLVNRSPGRATLDEFATGLKGLREVDQLPAQWATGEFGAAAVVVGGRVVGLVGVTPRTMFERYGGAIVALGTMLLFVGNLALALLVVKPIRSRLRDLHRTAARLRDGDLKARVTPRGSDELAEVARVFNEMATELVSRTSDLETSDRLRRQLIADVSHELMTPLTSVLARLETLAMDDIDIAIPERRAQATSAMNEARRLERVIGDLLASVRLESGGTALHFEEVSLTTLFAELASRHERECRSRCITLHANVAVPHLVGDPFRLEQALDNLVVNALRHTSDGGRIEITAQRLGATVQLVVWDSGGTIAAEHLPHIFDRFYKAESANGIASPGSGLGLSIVKAIALRHGGSVSAMSSPRDGTRFTMDIPTSARDEVVAVRS